MTIAWTPWRQLDLIRLRQAGCTPAECAAELGLPLEAVEVRIATIDSGDHGGSRAGRRPAADRRKADGVLAVRMHAAGYSTEAIGERLGCSQTRAQDLLREARR
jgi:hypothetical protein